MDRDPFTGPNVTPAWQDLETLESSCRFGASSVVAASESAWARQRILAIIGLIEQITRKPPIPLRQHDHQIPRDLETIILKALAKDPKDRFASADEMAVDLRLFLDNRPISSRALPSYERLWRWGKRNPSLAALNALALALSAAIALAAVVLKAERDEARNNLDLAHRNEMQAHQNAARGQRLSRGAGQRQGALSAIEYAVDLGKKIGGLDQSERLRLRNETIAAMALPDLRIAKEIDISDAKQRGGGTTFDAEMARYAVSFQTASSSRTKSIAERMTNGSKIPERSKKHYPPATVTRSKNRSTLPTQTLTTTARICWRLWAGTARRNAIFPWRLTTIRGILTSLRGEV